ncbi:MAG TPA: hypothetical protein VIL48_10815 [Acidimicrobiales bacterium]
MQVLVEISGDVDGRVHGSVALPDGRAVRFAGWLELLRLLEDCTTPTHDVAPGGSGAAGGGVVGGVVEGPSERAADRSGR